MRLGDQSLAKSFGCMSGLCTPLNAPYSKMPKWVQALRPYHPYPQPTYLNQFLSR